MADHNESKFEAELCAHLEANGWLHSPNDKGYDKERALFRADLVGLLQDTQPEEYAKVANDEQILDLVAKVLDGLLDSTGGTLNLLRRGFQTGTDGGAFDEADIGALSEHVVKRMLENPVVKAQVAANTPQHVAALPVLKEGFVDALVEAQAAYEELAKQLFDEEQKRADYFYSLIPLLFRIAEKVDTTGEAG